MAVTSPDLLGQLGGLFVRLHPEILMSMGSRNLRLGRSPKCRDAAHTLLLYIGLTLSEDSPEMGARSLALALEGSSNDGHICRIKDASEELIERSPESVIAAMAPILERQVHAAIRKAAAEISSAAAETLSRSATAVHASPSRPAWQDRVRGTKRH